MIVTSTPSVEGREVAEYLGLVAGEAVIGVNIFKDLFAGIRNIVGGRAAAYEAELAQARAMAAEDMEEMARERGANAVVGVDIDYEAINMDPGNMLMVSISGTAVKLR